MQLSIGLHLLFTLGKCLEHEGVLMLVGDPFSLPLMVKKREVSV
jgi:predicted glycoside hydrolase/deacetylase ChbG (UPF0249 family)